LPSSTSELRSLSCAHWATRDHAPERTGPKVPWRPPLPSPKGWPDWFAEYHSRGSRRSAELGCSGDTVAAPEGMALVVALVAPSPLPKEWRWWLPWWHRRRSRRNGAGGCLGGTVAAPEGMATLAAGPAPMTLPKKRFRQSIQLLATNTPKSIGHVHRDDPFPTLRRVLVTFTLATRFRHSEEYQSRSPWRPAPGTPKSTVHVHRDDPTIMLLRALRSDTVAT
jgi:hypothetical protein